MNNLTLAIGLGVLIFAAVVIWIGSNPVRIPGDDTPEQRETRRAWDVREQPSHDEIDAQANAALAETRRYVYREDDWS